MSHSPQAPPSCRLLRQAACVCLLGRAHCRPILDGLSGATCEHVFQGAQNADRIQVVVVSDVGDAEELAFHLALSVRHNRVERLAEFLDDFAGVDSVGRRDGGTVRLPATLRKASIPEPAPPARVMAAQSSALSTSASRPLS